MISWLSSPIYSLATNTVYWFIGRRQIPFVYELKKLLNRSRLFKVIRNYTDWRDLETWVRSRSRSLKMASFDRSHTSSYSSSIVTMPYLVSFPRLSETVVVNAKFSYTLPLNLHGHPEPLDFFSKILIQTVQVLCLFGGHMLRKSSTLWVGCNNVTDDRQTDGRHRDRRICDDIMRVTFA